MTAAPYKNQKPNTKTKHQKEKRKKKKKESEKKQTGALLICVFEKSFKSISVMDAQDTQGSSLVHIAILYYHTIFRYQTQTRMVETGTACLEYTNGLFCFTNKPTRERAQDNHNQSIEIKSLIHTNSFILLSLYIKMPFIKTKTVCTLTKSSIFIK